MQFTLNTSSLPASGQVHVEGDAWLIVARCQVDRVSKLYMQSIKNGEEPVGNFLLKFLVADDTVSYVNLYKEVLSITGIDGDWEENDWYQKANEATINVNGYEYKSIGLNIDVLPEYEETIEFPDDTSEKVQTRYYYFEREVEGQRERLFTAFETAPNGEKMLQFWVGYELPEGSFLILTPIFPDAETEYVDAGPDAEVGEYVEGTVDESESENGSEPESESAE